jgi:hypothetical protein
MELFEYDSHFDERINSYKCNFFHIYLDGASPINNGGFNKTSLRDYASFIHEYVHYIQQITTPYGIKYSQFFNYKYHKYREYINSKEEIGLPIILDEVIEPVKEMERVLANKNGSRYFNKCTIGEVEISCQDIILAREQDAAVNIGIYDFENERIYDDGFQFGYWCIIESMAHLVQSLINPDLHHSQVPYQAVQLICNRIRPDIRNDIKLLISICYVSLYFNNPGLAFFEILNSIPRGGENGISLYQRYMRDYSRVYKGEEMSNYRMMHQIMDNFVCHLGALVGNQLVYYKSVFDNCKLESSRGGSFFLDRLYNGDIGDINALNELLDFYGYPAIDSCSNILVTPWDRATKRPYLETAILISLELMIHRFEEKNGKTLCLRHSICDKNKDMIDDPVEEFCAVHQWLKTKECLFKGGLHYWGWDDKRFK